MFALRQLVHGRIQFVGEVEPFSLESHLRFNGIEYRQRLVQSIRQQNIFAHIEMLHQPEILKHKPNVPNAKRAPTGIGQFVHRHFAHRHRAGLRQNNTGEQPQ